MNDWKPEEEKEKEDEEKEREGRRRGWKYSKREELERLLMGMIQPQIERRIAPSVAFENAQQTALDVLKFLDEHAPLPSLEEL